MSIWSSVGLDDLVALSNDCDAANYRAEGEPGVFLDVATTSLHNHIRLIVGDAEVLLSPEVAHELAVRLAAAHGMIGARP